MGTSALSTRAGTCSNGPSLMAGLAGRAPAILVEATKILILGQHNSKFLYKEGLILCKKRPRPQDPSSRPMTMTHNQYKKKMLTFVGRWIIGWINLPPASIYSWSLLTPMTRSRPFNNTPPFSSSSPAWSGPLRGPRSWSDEVKICW